VMVTMMS
ncbi:hypothetical protein D020_2413B, partial [Vibrio parahaemolyticus SBR10290]